MPFRTLLALFLLWTGPDPQDPAESSLDGSQWSVRASEVGPTRLTGSQDGILFFHKGTLRSRLIGRRGLTPSAYRTWAEEEAIGFDAQSTNPLGHTVHWTGVVKGDDISGKVEVLDADGHAFQLSFRGVRSPALEGTRWLMTLVPTHDQSGETEPPILVRIGFWNGIATTNRESGGVEFQPTVYEMSLENGDWGFGMQQESIEGQVRQWSATIDGQEMVGSAQRRWTDGNVTVYDVLGRRIPSLEGTSWELDLTVDGGGSERTSLEFRDSRGDTTAVLGSELPPGSYDLTWGESAWHLVLVQLRGSTSRIWDASLDGDRLVGTVV